MKELNKLKAYRNKTKELINNVTYDIQEINSRKDIITEDKKNLTENSIEKGLKKIDNVMIELQGNANEIYNNASDNLQKVSRVDYSKIPVHESMMLASKTDEELLNLYRNRHYDKAQRALISDAIGQRIDSMANPDMSPLANDFVKLDKKLRPNLPEDERVAHEKLEQAKQLQGYADNLGKVLHWQKTKFERQLNNSDLKGEEKVSLRNIEHELNKFEETNNPYNQGNDNHPDLR